MAVAVLVVAVAVAVAPMNNCIICKEKEGVSVITDATIFPEKFNGEPICKECNQDREILKNTK